MLFLSSLGGSKSSLESGSPAFLALIGPTAVGKTELSLSIAERLNGEIVSADSRQVYRELSIGTAKPSPNELLRVPHHFIDELSITESFSAGEFARRANDRINRIVQRGRVPIIVGGSTLYLQALIHGLSEVPPSDATIRQRMEERLNREGNESLFTELQSVDPTSATKLDPTKTQRVIRALEVYMASGRPLSAYHRVLCIPPYRYDVRVLVRDRAILYERINKRVDLMLEMGLVDEVRGLHAMGHENSPLLLRTIGYREVIDYLEGSISKEEMVRLIKRNTRRYAKRQLTWFRRYDPEKWVYLDQPDTPPALLKL